MVRSRGCLGFSMLEAAIALVVLSVIATSVATTGSSQMRYFARSHEETVAERAAASRLELLTATPEPIAEGASTFALDRTASDGLHSATAQQTVRRVESGLLRVETEVTWLAADGGTAHVRLATLVAQETRK